MDTVTYPGGNPKALIGMTKPPMSAVPPVALIHLGQAMKDGRIKYGPMNWRETEVSSSVYYDALMRHVLAWWDGQDFAEDSGCHHLAHAMACCAIILDAAASKSLKDDRPPKGHVADLIKALTIQKETT